MTFQTYSSHQLSQESISRHKKKISSTKQISHIIEPHMPITYANNKPLPKPVPQTRATRNERTNEQNKDRLMMGQEMVPRRTDCQPFGRKDRSLLAPPYQHHKTVILNGKVNACVCVCLCVLHHWPIKMPYFSYIYSFFHYAKPDLFLGLGTKRVWG